MAGADPAWTENPSSRSPTRWLMRLKGRSKSSQRPVKGMHLTFILRLSYVLIALNIAENVEERMAMSSLSTIISKKYQSLNIQEFCRVFFVTPGKIIRALQFFHPLHSQEPRVSFCAEDFSCSLHNYFSGQ